MTNQEWHPMPISETELDNLLVDQKNEIINLIDQKELDEACAVLFVVKSLWTRANYEYKFDELIERMKLVADQYNI